MSEMTGIRFLRTDFEQVSSIRFAVNTTDKKQRALHGFHAGSFFRRIIVIFGR